MDLASLCLCQHSTLRFLEQGYIGWPSSQISVLVLAGGWVQGLWVRLLGDLFVVLEWMVCLS